MPPVFQRHLPNPHPYDAALAAWSGSTEPWRLAMSRNVKHDHRVSVEREAVLEAVGRGPRTADELQAAIDAYFNEKVRTRKLPDYVYEKLNGANIVVGGSAGYTEINRNVLLARVLDLNGMFRVYQ